MNAKRMPTVMLLLVVSWVVAASGLFTAAYIIFFEVAGGNSGALASLIILATLFLSGISRVLANMAQSFYEFRVSLSEDLHTLIERLTTVDQKAREEIRVLAESGRNQVQAIQSLYGEAVAARREDREDWDRQNRSLAELLDTLRKTSEDALVLTRQNQEASSRELQALNRQSQDVLSKSIVESSRVTRGELQSVAGLLEKLHGLLQGLDASLQSFSSAANEQHSEKRNILQAHKEELKNIYNNLDLIKDSLQHSGCDTKDVSQNIYQIKSFFEQIERHLDLKK